MKRSTFNYIKDILKDYPNIDKYIKDRMEELRVPYRDADVNAGIRGSNTNDAIANLMITIEQDRRLAALERNKRIIDNNLQECDSDTRTIIEELYVKKYQQYTMDGLISHNKINVSRRNAYRLLNQFFENVADDLGLEK